MRYERETGMDLSSPQAASFDSTTSIFAYIEQNKATFKKSRADGPQTLRSKIEPIAATIQTLCGTFEEAIILPFPPGKAIFAAIFVVIQASRQVSEDFDAALEAFDTIEHHLRTVKFIAARNMPEALREVSVKLLVQIVVVLGVITKLQKTHRLKLWLKKLGQSNEVSSALDDLGRLATDHHHIVSAATFNVVSRTLDILEASEACEAQARKDREESQTCRKQITAIAKQIGTFLDETAASSAQNQQDMHLNTGWPPDDVSRDSTIDTPSRWCPFWLQRILARARDGHLPGCPCGRSASSRPRLRDEKSYRPFRAHPMRRYMCSSRWRDFPECCMRAANRWKGRMSRPGLVHYEDDMFREDRRLLC
ncbi:hypothetical protein BD626DRAFT_512851 [Schizophyllum amplum]|uniref:Fungal STAND N-terminal Goodbye domain-containing protein n=1 Tax=Schizophyllum amplum TaxID=97359 RepID=A0A550C017_9AGAR|nr:hypothetical protein BD626DRAFT_512851 [Auriculariopsis ampla]